MNNLIIKKLWGILLLVGISQIFTNGVVVASDSTLLSSADSVSNRSAKETGKLFFWEVVSDKTVVYILGSVHVAKASMYPLDPSILKAYKQCAKIVVESDITDPEVQKKVMAFMQKNGQIVSGKTLEDYLSAIEIKAFKTMLPASLPYENAKRMRPWILQMNLALLLSLEYGYDPNLGLDMHFAKKAKEEQKPLLSLENPETVLLTMASLEWEEEMDLMRVMIRDSIQEKTNFKKEMKEEFDYLFDLWKKGDVEGLYKIAVVDEINKSPISKKLIKRLNNDRNIAWIPKIETYLKSDVPHFVIMGAMHPLGDEGVINLLSDKGYRVRQFDKTISK